MFSFQACHVPQLIVQEAACTQQIRHLFQQVQPLLQHIKHYIIDFARTEDGTMYIVELNHFHKTTGSALFNWKEDEHELQHGPFQAMRLIREPIHDAIDKLHAPLRDLAHECFATTTTTTAAAASCMMQ